jgi:pyridoxine 5-phosphate synthase
VVLLGVNIDHVATVRNARGGNHPDPIAAALLAEQFGADGITAHLREDRRHIRDADMRALRERIQTRLNMEMAATPEMIAIARDIRPEMVTLVPERRAELTTEGGLDVCRLETTLTEAVAQLSAANISVSLFIDPVAEQVAASARTGATLVEFHTGQYAEAYPAMQVELDALITAAKQARQLGLTVNAGHGLNYENVGPILQMPDLHELNIGHSLISEALFTGLGPAVARMKALLQ